MAFVKNLFDKNFIEYASYVIRDRAIPDLEDGLKPVQRRIMHTLFKMDDGRFQKVANVVGDKTVDIFAHFFYNIGSISTCWEGISMTPEQKAREIIDKRLAQAGWLVQDLSAVNPMASLGVAVREYPTSTGPVDYALFVEGKPVGVVEAKKNAAGLLMC